MAAFLKIVGASEAGVEAEALRAQYYALRARAFTAKWGENLYPDGPDNFDYKPDTAYALLVEDGKVIAGSRAIFHTPGSTTETPMETNHPAFHISKLLPHADMKRLCYCEAGGVVADPDPEYEGRHLGTMMFEGLFSLLRSGLIHSGRHPVDIIITSASSLGIGPIVRSANKLGIEGVLRRDLVQQEEDARFDTKLWPIVMKLRNFSRELVTDSMKSEGALGEPLAGFGTDHSIQYR